MDLGLLLAFILICHVQPIAAQEGSKSTTTCPVDVWCGNFSHINFPFFNLSSPRGCGLCMVDCEAKPYAKVALEIPAEHWYEVKSINNSIIKLYDPRRQDLLSNRDCHLFYEEIRLPNSPSSISYTTLQNFTLYRCSINPETRQRLTNLFSGYNNYDGCDDKFNFTIYYQNPENHAPQVAFNESYESNCSAVIAPIVSGYKDSGHSGLFELLTAEFDLQWHVSDDCYHCHREGNMCRIDWSTDSHCANAETGKKNLKVILGTAASVGGFAILVILACCFRRFSFYVFVDVVMRKTEKSQYIEDFVKNYGSLAPKRYHYSDVKKMTNSFKIKLGQGGYGSVYKGKLHDCTAVAVKVLKESKGSGEEFINEVASISRTSHVNIVNLQGFCYEGRKRALIYEFMPNGSLDKYIYGGKSSTNRQLGVQTLYKISVGIARGLEYLHSGCNTRILHFDVKPHNILLDRDFSPKISDFGLAKLCPGKESLVSMLGPRGTVGYIAPEVFCKNFGRVSHKSDVYSYGMMVFEMVGGRKNIDVGVDHTSEIYFPDWIYRKLDQSNNLGLDGITNEEENELARKMIIVSLWCIQTDPSNRPSMTKVVEMLEGSHQALQIPPKPFLFSPSGASDCISTVNMT